MSTGCQQGVNRASTGRQQGVNRVSTGCQKGVNRAPTWCQQAVDRVSTGCQRGVDGVNRASTGREKMQKLPLRRPSWRQRGSDVVKRVASTGCGINVVSTARRHNMPGANMVSAGCQRGVDMVRRSVHRRALFGYVAHDEWSSLAMLRMLSAGSCCQLPPLRGADGTNRETPSAASLVVNCHPSLGQLRTASRGSQHCERLPCERLPRVASTP